MTCSYMAKQKKIKKKIVGFVCILPVVWPALVGPPELEHREQVSWSLTDCRWSEQSPLE